MLAAAGVVKLLYRNFQILHGAAVLAAQQQLHITDEAQLLIPEAAEGVQVLAVLGLRMRQEQAAAAL
jgi:hypothetical protein